MTGNCSEGLRSKRPMVCVCVSLLLVLAVASAAATPRQAPEGPKLDLLEPEIGTTTDDDVEFIEGRIVGGKPVSVLRKRAHGGAATSKTSGGSGSSGSGAQMPRGDSSPSAAPGSGAQRPRPSTAGRPHTGDELKPDSSSWKPSSTGSSVSSGNPRPSLSSGNRPSSSHNPGDSFNRPRPGDYGQVSKGPYPAHGSSDFDNEHRGGMPNQSPGNGGSVPWNHQGVSPGYSAYPDPVTPAYTDDEPSSYNTNLVPTPNITPSHEQRPSHSSNPTNSPGGLRGGIVIGHPPGNSFSQHDSGLNRPSVTDENNEPRLEGGLVIGSPPANSLGGHSGGFNNHPPPQEIDQGRRGVVGPPHPQLGAGSFGLPSIPANPFVPANSGFQGPGSLPLPFGAGLFNPGLMNIQKAVEQAAAGVLGATSAGPNPASVFGRTSTFGQMSSFGFTERK